MLSNGNDMTDITQKAVARVFIVKQVSEGSGLIPVGVEILKDKITLEINYSAKEQKVNDLDYEVEVLSKWNEKLTSQMEQERETAKELIAQFGTTRAVNTKID